MRARAYIDDSLTLSHTHTHTHTQIGEASRRTRAAAATAAATPASEVRATDHGPQCCGHGTTTGTRDVGKEGYRGCGIATAGQMFFNRENIFYYGYGREG